MIATLRTGTYGGERRIFIKAPLHCREECRGLPGSRWHGGSMTWHVPATAASARAIVNIFDPEQMEWDDEVGALIAAADAHGGILEIKGAFDLPQPPVATEAWLHQRRAFHFAKQLDAAMLAMDMGTGKSLVALALLKEWDARQVLIMCPKSVVGVWPKQFRQHALTPSEWFVVTQSPNRRMRVVARAEETEQGLRRGRALGKRTVVVVNYDAAWRPEMSEVLGGIKWDVIVLDESHRVKSAGGKASLFATALRKNSRKRLALTGTPMPHSPMDVYAQYRFLDPGIFGTSKNRFQNRYAVTNTVERRDGRSFVQIEDWQNMEEFEDRFHSIAFVVSKEEALPDLPEKMPPVERQFSIGPKALRVYNELAREYVAGVEEGTIIAANAMTKMLRLRQVAAGHSKTDEGVVVDLDDERAKALDDVLEDLQGEPVVVFASFHRDLDAIERVASERGLRYGELSGRRRDGITVDSTMAEGVDVLGVQLRSGGVGIDLTKACTAIYYTVGYELGDYSQSQDRLHRPGQTRPVSYIHLVAENVPIDRIVFEALSERRSVVDAVLKAARTRSL